MAEEHKPRIYYLTISDFELKPNAIIPYIFGDKVNRANFTPAVIDSFAKSRGLLTAQTTYLEWLYHNTGFDYSTTFEHFLFSGGWSCLSSAEQELVTASIRRVHQHRKITSYPHNTGYLSIGGRIDHVLDMYSKKKAGGYIFLTPNELSEMSRDEFLSALANYATENRYSVPS